MWNSRATVLLPKYENPFPSKLNPYLEDIRGYDDRLVQETGIVSTSKQLAKYRLVRSPECSAWLYPTASLHDSKLIAFIMGWFFLYDDQFDGPLGVDVAGTKAVVARTKAVFHDYVPHRDDPLNYALFDYCRRIRPGMSDLWWERFTTDMENWLDAYAWETGLRAAQRIPSFEEYRANRIHSGGMLNAYDLVEVAERMTVPERFLRHEAVYRMLVNCCNIICWINDLISLSKEVLHKPFNNLLYVIQRHERCDLQEAVDRICALVRGLCAEVLAVQTEAPNLVETLGLSQHERENALRWVTAIIYCVSGSIVWQLESGRYSSNGQVTVPLL
jgi:hypothetical protein